MPVAMRLVERIGDLNGNSQHLVERQRSSPKRFGERLSIEILHDEKLNGLAVRIVGIRRRADVIERADVRMGQCRDRERFALETLGARPRLASGARGGP